jgi:hypothetical protein
MPGLLTEFADRARILSITASSAIEGVVVANADRAQRIIAGGRPRCATAANKNWRATVTPRIIYSGRTGARLMPA